MEYQMDSIPNPHSKGHNLMYILQSVTLLTILGSLAEQDMLR